MRRGRGVGPPGPGAKAGKTAPPAERPDFPAVFALTGRELLTVASGGGRPVQRRRRWPRRPEVQGCLPVQVLPKTVRREIDPNKDEVV